jgi:formate dehydrogenase assembly factor FdhD
MATESPSPLHDQSEHCDQCEHKTQHSVHVEIRTESGKPENAEFSREPYRITKCIACGNERSQRMNNA